MLYVELKTGAWVMLWVVEILRNACFLITKVNDKREDLNEIFCCENFEDSF